MLREEVFVYFNFKLTQTQNELQTLYDMLNKPKLL